MRIIVTPDGRGIGLGPINGNRLRHAVTSDRLAEKALGSQFVPLLGQQEINGLARMALS
jgi:hypothetical protein